MSAIGPAAGSLPAQALQRANRVRRARSALKARVAEGQLSAGEIAGKARRVTLDHLHVHQLRADPECLGHPVAGHDQPARGRLVRLACTARGEDRRLRVEHLQAAVAQVARDRVDAAAVVVLSRSVVNHSS
jgi:hypothetical protein